MAKKKTIAPVATLTLNLTQEHLDTFVDMAVSDLIDWYNVDDGMNEDTALKTQLGITRKDLVANTAFTALFTKLAQQFFDSHLETFDGQDVSDSDEVRKLYAKEIKAWEKGVKAREAAKQKADKEAQELLEREGVILRVPAANAERARATLQAAGLLDEAPVVPNTKRTMLPPAQAWPFPTGK